jgi:hypothetical protein
VKEEGQELSLSDLPGKALFSVRGSLLFFSKKGGLFVVSSCIGPFLSGKNAGHVCLFSRRHSRGTDIFFQISVGSEVKGEEIYMERSRKEVCKKRSTSKRQFYPFYPKYLDSTRVFGNFTLQ